MADYTPVFTGGAVPMTLTAGGAITGGQLVVASGTNTVTVAGLDATTCVGVAAHDAASGAKVTVWPLRNVTHELVSTGTIAAGDGVKCGAAGVVATVAVATGAAAGTLLGIAETPATGGALCRFIGR